jgi:putative thioredoxin
MAAEHVRDINAANFQKDVVERSMSRPVLLDFWAAWCGPCRTLGPVLERLVGEFHGAFELGKVDSDKEQDLAYAFGVQGIPFCVLVDGGRPVDAFQGALPEAEIRQFLQRNGIEPMLPPPKAEAAPAPAPVVDPKSPAARFERARQAAAAGNAAGVREALAGFPEEDERAGAVQRLLGGADWLEAALDANGAPAERRLAAARQRLVGKDMAGALDELIESVAADKTCRGGLARKAMLACFVVVGEEAELLDDYRRRLATLLY